MIYFKGVLIRLALFYIWRLEDNCVLCMSILTFLVHFLKFLHVVIKCQVFQSNPNYFQTKTTCLIDWTLTGTTTRFQSGAGRKGITKNSPSDTN